MSKKKVMRVIDKTTGLMECNHCGMRHYATTKDGKFVYGSWQCQNHCVWNEES